jgi:predicted transcriptional regulator
LQYAVFIDFRHNERHNIPMAKHHSVRLPGLSAVRRQRGLTQTELARRVRVSASFISKVEAGEKGVGIVVLDGLIEGLDTSRSALERAGVDSSPVS